MNSMSLDRFAYTLNCPTRYTDPTGHKDCNTTEFILGGLAVVGSEIPASVVGGVVFFTTKNPFMALQAFEVVNLRTYPLFLAGVGLIYHSGCVKMGP
jgi:hypothetical protein